MKKLILIFMLLLSLLIHPAYAAFSCGFQSPATGGSLGNLSMINISFADPPNTDGVNITVFATSVSTRNSSTATGTVISNISNTTGASGIGSAPYSVNFTFRNDYVIEDSNDYILDCKCHNSTTSAEVSSVSCNSTRTAVLVDRATPAVPSGITFTNPLVADNTITATINRILANRCFIRFGTPQSPRKAMTLSGSTCTFTVGIDNPPNSDYQAFVEADDRTNSTLSSVQSITIRARQSDGGGLFGGTLIMTDPQQSGQSILGGNTNQNPFAPKKNNNDSWVIWAVAGFFAFLYFKGKK